MRSVLAMGMAVMLAAAVPAGAATIVRDFSLSADRFSNFQGDVLMQPVRAMFRLTYDDTQSGFQGPPTSFSSTTNGVTSVGPFAAAPVFGYFPVNAFSTFPRLGVGGALNGGNVLVNGTDDFYFTFDASATGATRAMLSFTSASGSVPFTAEDAFVSPLAASVPEPSTWAAFIVGIGAIGGMLRRRRSAGMPRLA